MVEKNDNMEKLRILTEDLPPLLSSFAEEGSSRRQGVVKYDIEGTALGFALKKSDGIAIQVVFMSKGTTFPEHQHAEPEWVLVYQGAFQLKDKEGTIIGVGDCVKFSPEDPHSGTALEDCWFVAITIPEGEGYPDVE